MCVNEETDEMYLNFRDKLNDIRAKADAGDGQAALVMFGVFAYAQDSSPMVREQAYYYATIAMNAGLASGYFGLAGLLRMDGGAENERRAEELLRVAIEMNHLEAPGELGAWLLERGENLQEACNLLQRAVSHGAYEYFNDLMQCYQKLGNDKAAFKTVVNWVKKSASDGVAYYYLGCCYIQGTGTACNNHKAVEAFRRGADLGNIKCELMLANAYYRGIGTSKKPQKGTDLLRKVIVKPDDENLSLILSAIFDEVLPHMPLEEIEALAQSLEALDDKETISFVFRQYIQEHGIESLPLPLQKLLK